MPVKTWCWPSSRRTWCTQELGVARYTVDGDLGSGSLMLAIRIHIRATVLVVVLILLASGVIFPMGLVYLVVVVVLLAFSAVIVGRVRWGVVGGGRLVDLLPMDRRLHLRRCHLRHHHRRHRHHHKVVSHAGFETGCGCCWTICEPFFVDLVSAKGRFHIGGRSLDVEGSHCRIVSANVESPWGVLSRPQETPPWAKSLLRMDFAVWGIYRRRSTLGWTRDDLQKWLLRV